VKIIYRDEFFCVVDKPIGVFAHPPPRSRYSPPPEKIGIYLLQNILQRRVIPVHRLDAPTSGVMMYAFSSAAAKGLSRLFVERQVKKVYRAVVRGFVDEAGVIDLPLDSRAGLVEAQTEYRRLGLVEFPFAVGKRYSSARYSWVEAEPITGRWHQIRRHFDQISHPLLGDIEHGDSHHNRFFRDHLKIVGLCLRAQKLSFQHPWTSEPMYFEAPFDERWSRIESLFSGGKNPQIGRD
jgi:tRNA pseudouridine65 synthase